MTSEPKCAKCGACTVVCPVFRVDSRESLTARGKLHLLDTSFSDKLSDNFQDIFSRCLLCGACEDICPRDMPIREKLVQSRSRFSMFHSPCGVRKNLARFFLANPTLLEILVEGGRCLQRLDALPADSGLRLKLGFVEKKTTLNNFNIQGNKNWDTSKKSIVYFSGCLARHLQPSIAVATSDLLNSLSGNNLAMPSQQFCCGLAAWSAGNIVEARKLAKKNIEAFAETHGPILTSCGSCSSMLGKYFTLFEKGSKWHQRALDFSQRVVEFSQFFERMVVADQFVANEDLQVMYHDPCHLKFSRQGREAPRSLLAHVAGITRVEPEGGTRCCGQGGLFHLAYPDLSEKIFSKSLEAAEKEYPDVIVTSCSGCLMQWQAGIAFSKSNIKAMHLAVFLADCLFNPDEK